MNQTNEAPIIATITLVDSLEVVQYRDKDTYLKELQDFLDYRPSSIKFTTITTDPETRKGVDDLVFDQWGMENPHPLEYYVSKVPKTTVFS